MIFINQNPQHTYEIAKKWFGWVKSYVKAEGIEDKIQSDIASNVELTVE